MRASRLLFPIAFLLAPGFAAAQAGNNDYYQARATPESRELLVAVEKHHYQQGVEKMRNRLYAAAWGDFNFMLNYYPNHPQALLQMAQLCEIWRDPRCNMESYFGKAIARTPENDGVHLTRGIYLQKQGKLDAAIESYKKAIAINPDSANTHYNLGLAYAANKQMAQANAHAQQAYALGMTLPGLRTRLEAAKAWAPAAPKIPAEAPENEQGAAPPPASASQAGPDTPPADGIGKPR